MEELEKVIGRLGWRTHEERNTEGEAIGLEFERWTPAGEDWLVVWTDATFAASCYRQPSNGWISALTMKPRGGFRSEVCAEYPT